MGHQSPGLPEGWAAVTFPGPFGWNVWSDQKQRGKQAMPEGRKLIPREARFSANASLL